MLRIPQPAPSQPALGPEGHLPCTVAICFKPSPAAYPLCTLLIRCLEQPQESPYGLEAKPPQGTHPSRWHLQGEKVLPKSHGLTHPRTLGMLLKSMQRHYICTKYTGLAALTIPELALNKDHGVSFAQTEEEQQGRARYAGKD